MSPTSGRSKTLTSIDEAASTTRVTSPALLKLPHQSTLVFWIVQTLGTLPRPAPAEIVAPFMNHIATSPPVERQRMSLLPSPLKSWVTVSEVELGGGTKRPILPVANSTNHSAPSGPAMMPWTPLFPPNPGMGYSVMIPAVVICSIRLKVPVSVNHSAPSGPAVMPTGSLFSKGKPIGIG